MKLLQLEEAQARANALEYETEQEIITLWDSHKRLHTELINLTKHLLDNGKRTQTIPNLTQEYHNNLMNTNYPVRLRTWLMLYLT